MRKRDRDGRKRDEARKSIKNSRHETDRHTEDLQQQERNEGRKFERQNKRHRVIEVKVRVKYEA